MDALLALLCAFLLGALVGSWYQGGIDPFRTLARIDALLLLRRHRELHPGDPLVMQRQMIVPARLLERLTRTRRRGRVIQPLIEKEER